MPIPARWFLGWGGPLVRRLASWLWKEVGARDLPRCLVVTPTAHSGRRLREALAGVAGGGLLSPRFSTPDSLFRPGTEAAPKAVLAAAWARVLLEADPSRLVSLVPEASLADRDGTWAMAMADLVLPAVDRLAESALRPHDVARATRAFAELGAGDGEVERWLAIASLEAEVGAILAGLRLLIPAEAKIRRAQSPQLPPGIDRLVFAAVPDPVPLACLAAARLLEAGSVRIDVLVDAPSAMESRFDPWGRPLPGCWQREPIPLPGGNEAITITVDDEAAAKAAVAACAAAASNRIALCVPDTTLLPAMERAFLDAGWPVFDPDGRVAGGSGLLVFLDAQLAVLAAPRPAFESANALLRCPEAAVWLGFPRTHAVVRALDRLHAAALPESLDDALRALEKWAAVPESARNGPRMRRDSSLLLPVFRKLAACAAQSRRDGMVHVLYDSFDALANGKCDDGAGGALLAAVADSLASLALAVEAAPKLGGAALAACWRKSLPDVRAETARPATSLDALGWLESPYEAAPHLVVAGMHHGCVPDGVREDAFLPDSLRAALGLRTQATRDARDAFLFRAMVEARRVGGSVRVVVSKFDGAGEPRKPSALLLLCEPDDLAVRVRHVFPEFHSENAPARPARSRGQWVLSFPRDPDREKEALGVIHPTLVKNYLRCPVRCYLGTVLGMTRYDPDQKELAATDFGSLVHGVLEAFGSEESMRGCADAREIAASSILESAGTPPDPGRMPLNVGRYAQGSTLDPSTENGPIPDGFHVKWPSALRPFQSFSVSAFVSWRSYQEHPT